MTMSPRHNCAHNIPAHFSAGGIRTCDIRDLILILHYHDISNAVHSPKDQGVLQVIRNNLAPNHIAASNRTLGLVEKLHVHVCQTIGCQNHR
jgi:hypothetical protein